MGLHLEYRHLGGAHLGGVFEGVGIWEVQALERYKHLEGTWEV